VLWVMEMVFVSDLVSVILLRAVVVWLVRVVDCEIDRGN
jgi:hypothetical protein